MNGGDLSESSDLRLLGLSLHSELSWNSYIVSIAKSTSKKVGSLFRSKRFLTPEAILHLYKYHSTLCGILLSYLGWCSCFLS